MELVQPLRIDFDYAGAPQTVFPALLGEPGEALLVDALYPGQLPLLEEALRAAGFRLEDLAAVLVTHHDFDHLGALAALKRAHPGIRILASAAEAPFIDGRTPPLRLVQAEAREAFLPEEARAWSAGFRRMLAGVEKVVVDRTVEDGELVGPGKARSIATPGHTRGHLSVFVEDEGLLIAGDALALDQGRLVLANPEYAEDLPAARASAARLATLPIQRILCYHGGLFQGDARAALMGAAGLPASGA